MTSLYTLQKTVHVGKDKTNEFGGYNYRTAEGILSAIKAHMPEGATIVVTDTLQEVAGQIFVTATAKLSLPDEGEYTAQGHAMHPLTKKGMDPSQITGAASSYARKYALAGLMALDDSSADPDAQKTPYAPDEKPPFDSKAAADRLVGLIGKAADSERLIEIKKNEKTALDALTDADFDRVKTAFAAAKARITPEQDKSA